MKKIAILASGSGTNAENITRFFNEGNRLRVSLLLVDRKNAPVVERLAPYGIETVWFPRDAWRHNPAQIIELLREKEIDLIVLAGFNTILPAEFVEAFPRRILNIHPSLLPEFGGEGMWGVNVHRAVIEARRDKSGATVHYVDNNVDAGEILMNQEVPVLPDDTPESLEQRVHQAEYVLYPRAIVEALRRLDTPVSADQAWAKALQMPLPESASEESAPSEPAQQDSSSQQSVGAEQLPPPIPAPQMPKADVAPESEKRQEMPPTYMVWSILCTLACCFIPGIVAILFSSKVSTQYYNGDYEGAKRASRMAEIWIIASFCLGVLSATVYMPLSLLVG